MYIFMYVCMCVAGCVRITNAFMYVCLFVYINRMVWVEQWYARIYIELAYFQACD